MTIYSQFRPFTLKLALVLGTISIATAQTETLTSSSAANYRPIVAPNSIVALWGSGLASTTMAGSITNSGSGATLPTNLDGVRLSVAMNAQTTVTPSLYLVSPDQINYVLPGTTGLGAGIVTVTSATATYQGPLLVSNVSPSIFTADGSGSGAPAAQIMQMDAAGNSTFSPMGSALTLANGGGSTYLLLYGTGIRNHSLNPVIATINGNAVPVQYAGPQGQYPGLDQINLGPLPSTLSGLGTADVLVTADGVPSNKVQVHIQ